MKRHNMLVFTLIFMIVFSVLACQPGIDNGIQKLDAPTQDNYTKEDIKHYNEFKKILQKYVDKGEVELIPIELSTEVKRNIPEAELFSLIWKSEEAEFNFRKESTGYLREYYKEDYFKDMEQEIELKGNPSGQECRLLNLNDGSKRHFCYGMGAWGAVWYGEAWAKTSYRNSSNTGPVNATKIHLSFNYLALHSTPFNGSKTAYNEDYLSYVNRLVGFPTIPWLYGKESYHYVVSHTNQKYTKTLR